MRGKDADGWERERAFFINFVIAPDKTTFTIFSNFYVVMFFYRGWFHYFGAVVQKQNFIQLPQSCVLQFIATNWNAYGFLRNYAIACAFGLLRPGLDTILKKRFSSRTKISQNAFSLMRAPPSFVLSQKIAKSEKNITDAGVLGKGWPIFPIFKQQKWPKTVVCR